MDKTCLRPHEGADTFQESCDIVFCNFFKLSYLGETETGFPADRLGGFFWNQIKRGHRLARGHFHVEHDLEPVFLGPNFAHLRQGVTTDQTFSKSLPLKALRRFLKHLGAGDDRLKEIAFKFAAQKRSLIIAEFI